MTHLERARRQVLGAITSASRASGLEPGTSDSRSELASAITALRSVLGSLDAAGFTIIRAKSKRQRRAA